MAQGGAQTGLLLHFDGHLLDSALKGERNLIGLRHRRHGIAADVEWFHAVAERHGLGHAACPSFLAIDEQLDVRRFAGAGLDRSQLHADGGFALGQGLLRLDAGVVHLKKVVRERGPAVLHVERPVRGNTADGGKHTVAARLADLHLGRDAKGHAVRIENGRLADAAHARAVGEALQAGQRVGPQGGVETLRQAIVERQHAVFLCFNEEGGLSGFHLLGVLGCEIIGLAEILCDVVEFPRIGVEPALILLPIRLGRVMWPVNGAGREIHEPWLVRVRRMPPVESFYGRVSQVYTAKHTAHFT